MSFKAPYFHGGVVFVLFVLGNTFDEVCECNVDGIINWHADGQDDLEEDDSVDGKSPVEDEAHKEYINQKDAHGYQTRHRQVRRDNKYNRHDCECRGYQRQSRLFLENKVLLYIIVRLSPIKAVWEPEFFRQVTQVSQMLNSLCIWILDPLDGDFILNRSQLSTVQVRSHDIASES